MDVIVLILMLRTPADGIMSQRVEVPTIEDCWKSAADFLKQDVKALGAEEIGAACEIHRGPGRES